MLLWEKMKKAAEYHHEKQAQKEEAYREQYGEGGRELEKGDVPAMLISAFLVLLPGVLIILLLLVGAAYFFVVHS